MDQWIIKTMVRTHKSENQVSISGTGKEESGASKRKRKIQEEKRLEGYRSSMAKFLRPVERGDGDMVSKYICCLRLHYLRRVKSSF